MRFIILALVAGALAMFLHARYPYLANSNTEMVSIIYLVFMIALIGGGLWASGRYRFMDTIKFIVIWIAIILALILGYSYRDKLQWNRIKAELFPNHVQMTMGGALSVQASADGHFHIEAEINGALVDFLVDTGASDIVLSPSDAQRAGFLLDTLTYSRLYSTANGTGAGAAVVINTFQLGYVTFQRLPASVNSAAMDSSLLGMSFLRQFKSYRVDGDTLTLYP